MSMVSYDLATACNDPAYMLYLHYDVVQAQFGFGINHRMAPCFTERQTLEQDMLATAASNSRLW